MSATPLDVLAYAASDVTLSGDPAVIQVSMPEVVDNIRAFPVDVKINDQSIRSKANHFQVATGDEGGPASNFPFRPNRTLSVVQNYNGENLVHLSYRARTNDFKSKMSWIQIKFYSVKFLGNLKTYNSTAFGMTVTTLPGVESRLYAVKQVDSTWNYYDRVEVASVNRTFNIVPLVLSMSLPQLDFKKYGFDTFVDLAGAEYRKPTAINSVEDSYVVSLGTPVLQQGYRLNPVGTYQETLKTYQQTYQTLGSDLLVLNATNGFFKTELHSGTNEVNGKKMDYYTASYDVGLALKSELTIFTFSVTRSGVVDAGQGKTASENAVKEAQTLLKSVKLAYNLTGVKPVTTTVSGGSSPGINIAIIPISLADKPITKSLSYYNEIASKMADYFKETSYGTLKMNVKVIQKDGSWLTIKKTAAQYAGNNAEGIFLQDAVDAADDVLNYNQYDNTADGGKGIVAFITNGDLFKGGSFIMSKQDSDGYFVTKDGVKVDAIYTYEQRFEPVGKSQIIRGLAHETAHALGKLLVTSVEGSARDGRWWVLPDEYLIGNVDVYMSLMGNVKGNYGVSQVNLDSYSKQWLGWLKYNDLAMNQTVTIKALDTLSYGDSVYRYSFNEPGTLSPSYYILEVRAGSTKWDSEAKMGVETSTYIVVEAVRTFPNKLQTINWIEWRNTNAMITNGESWLTVSPLGGARFNITAIDWKTVRVTVQKYPVKDMTGVALAPSGTVLGKAMNVLPHETSRNITIPDLDLHAYTADGKHIGLNYATGEYENQVPGALASGDLVNGEEWIFAPSNVKLSYKIDSRKNAEFLKTVPEAKSITDGTDGYSLTAIQYAADGTRYVSQPSTQQIAAGTALEQTVSVNRNQDGTYSLSISSPKTTTPTQTTSSTTTNQKTTTTQTTTSSVSTQSKTTSTTASNTANQPEVQVNPLNTIMETPYLLIGVALLVILVMVALMVSRRKRK
ncbi:MAG: hypothetical protein M1503_05320 [Thaumarchaeota archaeon]|nr:hypothetical protein [Nitrososphaerota archaeon]MCL5317671.1 hypothetical protein [Nitrososphaerota archaeon]